MSCRKQSGTPVEPYHTATIPEMVERTILGVATKDWTSLVDTLNYFNTHFLLRGKTSGYGPDDVYYELRVNTIFSKSIKVLFYVEKECLVKAEGTADLQSLTVTALGTTFTSQVRNDSLQVNLNDVGLIVPVASKIPFTGDVLYRGEKVGYFDFVTLEGITYSKGLYPVVHYFDDTRTFSYYEHWDFIDGIAAIKKMISDVLE